MLTDDEEGFLMQSELEDLREKIRLIYRMAAHHKQRYLVLGEYDPQVEIESQAIDALIVRGTWMWRVRVPARGGRL